MIDAQGSVPGISFATLKRLEYAINSFEASKAAFELSLIFSCEENCNKKILNQGFRLTGQPWIIFYYYW